MAMAFSRPAIAERVQGDQQWIEDHQEILGSNVNYILSDFTSGLPVNTHEVDTAMAELYRNDPVGKSMVLQRAALLPLLVPEHLRKHASSYLRTARADTYAVFVSRSAVAAQARGEGIALTTVTCYLDRRGEIVGAYGAPGFLVHDLRSNGKTAPLAAICAAAGHLTKEARKRG